MYIDLNILGLYILTAVMIIGAPGPVVVLVAGAGLSGGIMKACRTILGTNIAVLVLILFSVLMEKGFFSVSETALNIVKLAGTGYIAWMGRDILQEASRSVPGQATVQFHAGGFFKGFITGITNPKYIVFFVAFFPQFIGITTDMDISIALLAVLWVVFSFLILMLVYILIRKLLEPSTYQAMLRVSGIFLLFIAIVGTFMVITDLWKAA